MLEESQRFKDFQDWSVRTSWEHRFRKRNIRGDISTRGDVGISWSRLPTRKIRMSIRNHHAPTDGTVEHRLRAPTKIIGCLQTKTVFRQFRAAN